MTAALIGCGVALLIGLTGVGGGTLTVPALVLLVGVEPSVAVGTALAFSALVKLPAAGFYLRRQHVDFHVWRLLLLGGLPGVVGGSLLLSRLSHGALRPLVLTVVGCTIAATALFSLLLALGRASQTRPRQEHRARLPWFAAAIGVEVGFSSAGAGALGTLVLLHQTALSPAQVVGTDLLFGLALSAVGGALHLGLGEGSWSLLWRLVAGGVPGVLAGAWLGTRLPARYLRLLLLAWLVYLGSQLAWRGWSDWMALKP